MLVLTNTFIVAYLVFAWCWDLPGEHWARRLVWPVRRAFFYVRARKFVDNVLEGKVKWLRPALCEFLWRQWRARGIEPVRIELVGQRRLIAGPDEAEAAPEVEKKTIYVFKCE